MKRLFVEIYLDEDVSALVGELLRARGFAVTTTREASQVEASDESQLAFAISRKLTVATHNRNDFAKLAREYFELGNKHYGIILMVRRPPRELVKRLVAILNQTSADEMENQVVYI